ncbi:MAG: hypothetical protein A2008_04980 [Candidatus Wallbacteria bacterium GWC2_49_35]|uniref:SH3b domain-containing protein n=1 Tax=Candidatus Wallbacteria bacterium GWC2_49_35 TaxID=1817813 RepID=A0A1F7WGA8_9BACT|nr:MAG: hypothetical protein A2008_04980 [Candidatus Wallbacteria bacterium GWC2_49_35]HBC74432.1 hypothetical protein [Candidatus Wallbacteria bacterium]
MSKNIYNKITVSIICVFILSLFMSSAGVSRTYAGGIEDLNQSVNKLEISNDNTQTATGNQSQAAAGDGVQATTESVASGVESIKKGFKGLFEGFKDIFKGIIDLFKQLINEFKKLFSSAENDIKQAGEEIGSAANQAANDISGAATEGANAVEGATQGVGVEVNNNGAENQNQPAGGDAVPPASTDESGASAPAVSDSSASAAQSGTVIDEDPNGLNIRTGPWGEIIGTLQKGTKIEITGKEGEWYKIKFNGKDAYVYADLVAADAPAAQADANANVNETETEGANPESDNSAANADANNTDAVPAVANNEAADTENKQPAEPAAAEKKADASTPYFNQYDNDFFSASTCQNTSLAMVLAKYGWNGTPDQVTKTFGKDMAQTPAGLENVFNGLAQDAGLSVRIKSHTDATMEFVNKLLAEGKPVIAHGWFTPSGHVVTITGFDGQNYTVNDPAGQWNGKFKGGYSGGSGKGVKYSKEALTEALVEDGEVWCHEVINTGDKVAGL